MCSCNWFVLFSVIFNAFLSVAVYCAQPRLRGVTLESHPFIIKDGIEYKGYLVDVLDQMKNISDFDYYFYDNYSPQELGTIDKRHRNVSGLLGELLTNRADFGVSNIVVTKERERYVDFTDPLLNFSAASALILKRNAINISSFQQLADQMRVTYGSLRDSPTMELFEDSQDIVLQRMYALMKSRGVSVDSLEEAYKRVKTDRYAFIADSLTVEQLAKRDCDLTVITDNRQYFRRHISIALPKGSKFLDIFNQFIKQLKGSEIMDQIRDKYFKPVCSRSSNTSITQNSSINLIIVFNILFILSKVML